MIELKIKYFPAVNHAVIGVFSNHNHVWNRQVVRVQGGAGGVCYNGSYVIISGFKFVLDTK